MNKIIDQIKSTISGLRKGNVKETPSQSSVNWFSKKLQNIKNTTKGKVNPQNDSARKNIINDKFATKAFKYKKSGYIYFFNYQTFFKYFSKIFSNLYNLSYFKYLSYGIVSSFIYSILPSIKL